MYTCSSWLWTQPATTHRVSSHSYHKSTSPPTNHYLSTAKCFDPVTFKNIGVFNSSINIFTDLLFALIPIPMVWRLQVNLQTRIGLAVILSLGLFASAVAIYKTPLQYRFFEEKDFSGNGAWYYIWYVCIYQVIEDMSMMGEGC
jgi:hypothetical protein